MTTASRRRSLLVAGALVAFFVFRLLYGLSSEFFFEDETQIYLMGLRYYATGEWPYFGADVVWTRSEIPGALQALLVGFPLKIAAVPEAPFVLLNLLSVAALGLFAWLVTLYWGHRHAGATLWTTLGPPGVARALNHVLMAAALVLVTVAVVPGSVPPSGVTS